MPKNISRLPHSTPPSGEGRNYLREKTPSSHLKGVVFGHKKPNGQKADSLGQQNGKYPFPGQKKKRISLGGALGGIIRGMRVEKKNGASTKNGIAKKLPYGGKKQLKRKEFEQWLLKPERSNIYKRLLPNYKIKERGLGFIPKDTGSGYFDTWALDKKLKDLEFKDLPSAKTNAEKESIRQDLMLLKEYKKELERPPHN